MLVHGAILILSTVFVWCVVVVGRRAEWRLNLVPFFGAIVLFGTAGVCLAGTE